MRLLFFGVVVLVTACDSNAAKQQRAQTDVTELRRAVEVFQQKEGRYPDALVDLEVARVTNVLPDPWGNPYLLRYTSGAPLVICTGSDGALGGSGDAADVTSEPTNRPTLKSADRP